jgi:hypothetical protein
MNRFLTAVVCIIWAVLHASTNLASAEEPKFESIFNGKTLDGWTVIGCEAEVVDGAIFLKAGNGVVHTNKRYGDFVLQLEWKAERENKYDSGIYFRCELPEGKRPWPTRYQANLLQGQEGNIGGIKGATSKGLIKPGEWNRFELSVIGSKVAMKINGKDAYEADGIAEPEGYICLQSEVPGGGQFSFRNIRIATANK